MDMTYRTKPTVRPARIAGPRVATPSAGSDAALGTFDKIATALGSDRFISYYAGFFSGCMATVGLALLWSAAS